MGTVRSFETKMMRSSVCFRGLVGSLDVCSECTGNIEEKLVLVK